MRPVLYKSWRHVELQASSLSPRRNRKKMIKLVATFCSSSAQERSVVAKNYELEDTPEQLLASAYALRGDDPEETLRLYSDWAETYDQTMLGGLSYSSPQRVAALAAVTEERAMQEFLMWAVGLACSQVAYERGVLIESTASTTLPPCWQSRSARAGLIKPSCAI